MLTADVRKFTDADVKAAVRLLDMVDGNVDEAMAEIRRAAKVVKPFLTLIAANAILDRLDRDVAAANQLLIVTDSFRKLLGYESLNQQEHGR